MDGGDELRERGEDRENKRKTRDILASFAISRIYKNRRGDKDKEPKYGTAYILRSLKRPEEVETLRDIYGGGFYLIGIYTPKTIRVNYLKKKGCTNKDINELMERDEKGLKDYGQATRDTFTISDYFLDASKPKNVKKNLYRFLDLIFGHQYTSPTPDEHGMFLAHAAAMRSLSLSRQVGACITTPDHDVIAVGTNDVPCAGGGLYWSTHGKNDCRDHKWIPGGEETARDSNDHERARICDIAKGKIQKSLQDSEGIKLSPDSQRRLANAIDESIAKITEYGRSVHAEMDALFSCARSGISPQGAILYATLFPCHNCARHIITAGIKEVIFLEPYPKSFAKDLHNDSFFIEGDDLKKPKKSSAAVCFRPFTGVAARRYIDLFSMKLGWGYLFEGEYGRKNDVKDPKKRGFISSPNEEVRVKLSPISYIEAEKKVLSGTMKYITLIQRILTNQR